MLLFRIPKPKYSWIMLHLQWLKYRNSFNKNHVTQFCFENTILSILKTKRNESGLKHCKKYQMVHSISNFVSYSHNIIKAWCKMIYVDKYFLQLFWVDKESQVVTLFFSLEQIHTTATNKPLTFMISFMKACTVLQM